MTECIDHGRRGTLNEYAQVVHEGVMLYRHRLAYCEANDVTLPAIKGKVVRHTCDNPRCINPEHLLIGTPQDNSTDMTRRGRQAKGVAHPRAKLTEADVQFIRKHYKPCCKTYGGSVLAKRFKVSPSIISGVVKRLGWQHL